MSGLQVRRQLGVARARHCRHHAIGADGDDPVGVGHGDRRAAQAAFGVRLHRVDDVADERVVARAARIEPGRLVATPDHRVGRRLDLGDLVAIDALLVAGEVQHPGALRPHCRADREQHGIAEPAAGQDHGFVGRDLRGGARRAHQDHGFTRPKVRAQVRRTAHLEHDRRHQTARPVDPGAGQRQPLHRQPGRHAAEPCDWRQRFEVLQAVELPGLKLARRHRRVDDDFDDVRRQALDPFDARAQQMIDAGQKICEWRRRRWCLAGEYPRHDRIALLGRAHGLDDVARPAGMQVAEEGQHAPVGHARQQHLRGGRFAGAVLGADWRTVFVDRLEILAVEAEMHAVFAGQHGVGLRAGGDEHAACRQHEVVCVVPAAVAVSTLGGQGDRAHGARFVDVDAARVHALGDADAFLERLLHLFVVQGVRRAVDQPLAIGEGDAAPLAQKPDDIGVPAFGGGTCAFVAQRASVAQELLGGLCLARRPGGPHSVLADRIGQCLMPREELLDLNRVVRE